MENKEILNKINEIIKINNVIVKINPLTDIYLNYINQAPIEYKGHIFDIYLHAYENGKETTDYLIFYDAIKDKFERRRDYLLTYKKEDFIKRPTFWTNKYLIKLSTCFFIVDWFYHCNDNDLIIHLANEKHQYRKVKKEKITLIEKIN